MQKETGEQETEESQLEVVSASRCRENIARRLQATPSLVRRGAVRGLEKRMGGEISPKEEASFPGRFRAEASPVRGGSPLKIFGG